MPLQATSGAASYDAFGGGVAAVPNYIEECFSTTLYTGTGASQTITTGIDVSTKGGIVWTKARATNSASSDHVIHQTNGNSLVINGTGAEYADGDFGSITTTGFTLPSYPAYNASGIPFASWTFRKQPKFFDVVTWTGDDSGARTITHNLGSAPGCIIVKTTSGTSDWFVYHRGNPSPAQDYLLRLNSTVAAASGNAWDNYAPTSTDFRVSSGRNVSGTTYVAYLFAHDAGGFGLTGTDNVISCGSFTTDGSGNATVSLGYEPQWFLVKKSSGTGNWFLTDTMRGFTAPSTSGADTFVFLNPNTSDVEAGGDIFKLNSTGVNAVTGVASDTWIYIAIRRGPMKVPTSGTSVFAPQATRGPSSGSTSATNPNFTAGFPVDKIILGWKGGGISTYQQVLDRLRGARLSTSNTDAEASTVFLFDSMTGIYESTIGSSTSQCGWMFRRAPSFFDEVCYTGNGVNSRMVTHNLGVQPELLIIKRRDAVADWSVAGKLVGGFKIDAFLNTTAAFASGPLLDLSAEITSTAFQPQVVGNYARGLNTSGGTYVAYLFATCAGVSKVTSFTGNGSSQTINCGFTGGARFVLIKRTDSTGDWYIWDSARGIVSGNDPHLSLNSTAAEVTTDDTIDTDSTGFIVNQVSATNCNVNGASYIVLAVA